MRLESAEHRQEKGRTRACRVTAWVGRFPCRGQEAPQCALTGILEVRPAGVKSNCFLEAGVIPTGPSFGDHPPTGRPMRSRAFFLFTALPIALAVAPSVVHSQSYVYRDCRDRYSASGTLYYSCSYDAEFAARARAAAARARAEASEAARWARSYSRSYASTVRADNRAWEASVARALRTSEARFRADEARIRANETRDRARERALERTREARERAQESRERARERAEDRARDQRYRYYNRW